MRDIQIAEVHDCFTIEETFFLEDSGFCKKGEGWKIIYDSYESFKFKFKGSKSKHIPYVNGDKEMVVNPGGGLKADDYKRYRTV